MTEYDRRVQTAQVSEEELPVLVSCLVHVANTDGVFSSEERAFLSGIVESFADSPELSEAFVDSSRALPESVEISDPEIAVLLSYMLAYTSCSRQYARIESPLRAASRTTFHQ